MKKAFYPVLLVAFVVALLAPAIVTGQTPTRDRFVISARAGGINAVTGRATMHSRGGSEWQLLSIKEDLEAGDVVKTGADGRVEMLLNPGSYLRIGENSEFELTDNTLANLEVRLIRGTAIVEATGADDSELLINITTSHTRMAIVRRGLYRVNVIPGDATELIVRKGRVMLSDSNTKIKGGNKVIFSSGSVSVAKLQKADKKKTDDLEDWSKQRGELVARANRKLRGRDLNVFLASNSFYGFRTSGVWLFNPTFGCYTFLPFYFGWGSPYGASYANSFYGGCCSRSVFGYGRGFDNSYPTGGSSIPSGNSPTRTVSAPAPVATPIQMTPSRDPGLRKNNPIN